MLIRLNITSSEKGKLNHGRGKQGEAGELARSKRREKGVNPPSIRYQRTRFLWNVIKWVQNVQLLGQVLHMAVGNFQKTVNSLPKMQEIAFQTLDFKIFRRSMPPSPLEIFLFLKHETLPCGPCKYGFQLTIVYNDDPTITGTGINFCPARIQG